jgi:hypothetical protein
LALKQAGSLMQPVAGGQSHGSGLRQYASQQPTTGGGTQGSGLRQ